eukprot:CAMPEP_0172518214 /NCGR_PEP_ID=MMETSP1066-20121228/290683_1 /TAXON_ID=671091 /ORGANISM="Coscinodiscus wailesii, Strain CCMP2513" /LENGTH=363 /DNA_ID=CAMNT_0013300551 /DNA_START=160 /DNA_END=1248 /DNA_ORIENTATION=-
MALYHRCIALHAILCLSFGISAWSETALVGRPEHIRSTRQLQMTVQATDMPTPDETVDVTGETTEGTLEGTTGETLEGTAGETLEGTAGETLEGTPGETTEGTPGETTEGTPGETTEGTPGESTISEVEETSPEIEIPNLDEQSPENEVPNIDEQSPENGIPYLDEQSFETSYPSVAPISGQIDTAVNTGAPSGILTTIESTAPTMAAQDEDAEALGGSQTPSVFPTHLVTILSTSNIAEITQPPVSSNPTYIVKEEPFGALTSAPTVAHAVAPPPPKEDDESDDWFDDNVDRDNDDDLDHVDDDLLPQEQKVNITNMTIEELIIYEVEEHEDWVIAGAAMFASLLLMVFTAYQVKDNPNGLW